MEISGIVEKDEQLQVFGDNGGECMDGDKTWGDRVQHGEIGRSLAEVLQCIGIPTFNSDNKLESNNRSRLF